MPQSVSQLKPYKSLLLGHVRQGVALAPLVNDVLTEVARLIETDDALRLEQREDARSAGQLVVGFVHYVQEHPVAWTSDASLVDPLNQLVLVCRRHRHVAIYASDQRFRTRLAARFGDSEATGGIGALDTIPSGVLNAAFVRGPTRTLWLGGTHRRTTVKADSKILSGIDLRDALDPLDDQSYYFSAARSLVGGLPVGVTPRRSSLWAGTSRDWPDFRETLESLLSRLEAVTEPSQAPLPVLAVTAVTAGDIDGAFDVSLQPPELLSDDPTIEPEMREDLERWGLRARFEVVGVDGADVRTQVSLDDERLGSADFAVNLEDPERIRWEVTGEPASQSAAELHAAALLRCHRVPWVKIRYDSGHTISDGAVFRVRFRDAPFTNFLWADLEGFRVGREKPSPLGEVGKQDSLFDWVQRFWPDFDQGGASPGGWLACDDGSMEVADFIHVDDEASPPVLSLIHVKGANSERLGRQISVSAYEVVVGQAVKNLRYLDRLALEEGLAAGIDKMVGKLVWRNRTLTTRTKMIEALREIGTNYERRLVVFQPHVTRIRHDAARGAEGGSELARLRQLDALLLGADADAHALGARFTVLADRR